MSNNKSIKAVFLLNYIILFSGIAFSLYYAHNLFLNLKEKSANQNLLAINKLSAKGVNTHLEYVSNSVKTLGDSYKKLYEQKYEHIKNKPIHEHKYIKNEQITFFNDFTDQKDFTFQSDHVSMILSNLNQDKEAIGKELNIFHQLTPALESLHNSFHFSWVYITTANDFMLIYPYVPYVNASDIYKPTQQHFYKAANFAQKSIGWEEPYNDIAGAGVLITASYPIYDKDEKLLGVASHDITVNKVAESILNETTMHKGSISFLISKQGRVISSTNLEQMQEMQKQNKQEYKGNFYYRTIKNAKENGLNDIKVSAHEYLNELGDEIISTIKPVKDVNTILWNSSIDFFHDKLLLVSQIPATEWILVSCVPKESIVDETRSIFYQTLLILSIFITTLFIFSGILTMRHLIAPLDIINKASKSFGDGYTDVKVQYSNMNLLKTLFDTFNIMVEKVKFNQQLLEEKVYERTAKLQKEINRRKTIEEELRKISRTDALTGIWNRRYFFEMLDREISRSQRYDIKMSLLMIDIDLFKNINDTWGHDIGDKAIKHVVDIINSNVRKENIFSRLGGEEFGIILIETKAPYTPQSISERIRKSIEASPLIVDKESIKITVSIGIANIMDNDTANTLYVRSDRALYLAKENGRNRVEEV
ncbi:diguanylate cyclase [Sulfurimonas sp.]|uniref:sensor domain-containing diguanylate cyclase n=1 Tax=Sulfurimonas sp. TaxID=2022749 RepID=UPI00356A7F56